jgi:hypothetical protein
MEQEAAQKDNQIKQNQFEIENDSDGFEFDMSFAPSIEIDF